MTSSRFVRLAVISLALVAVVAVARAVLAGARPPAPEPKPVPGRDGSGTGPERTVTEQQTLQPGGILELSLDANVTTGYSWDVAELDESKVRLVSNEYVADPNPDQLVGTGGRNVVRLEALQRGQTTIKLVYRRPWETGVEPERTRIVELSIQ